LSDVITWDITQGVIRTLGIEIEMVGLGCRQIAEVVSTVVHGRLAQAGFPEPEDGYEDSDDR
jgi:hypothetical protein